MRTRISRTDTNDHDTSASRGRYQTTQPSTSSQQQPQPRQSLNNPNIGNYDKTRAAMQSQSTEGHQYALRYRSANQPPDRYDANAQRTPKPCYHCQATDHVIRDCPTRPAAESSYANNQQVQQAAINNVSINGECLMNQKSVKFTTDTGSPVTLISEQTFNFIGAKYNN